MVNYRLREVLSSISKQLTEFRCLNSGGCCYIAYLIAKQLESRKIPFSVIFEHSEQSLKSAYIRQANNTNKGLGVTHVLLRIDGVYYDSDGIKGSRMHKDKIVFNWNSKQLHNFWMNGRWNFLFKANNPSSKRQQIRSIINQTFKEYDKSSTWYRWYNCRFSR